MKPVFGNIAYVYFKANLENEISFSNSRFFLLRHALRQHILRHAGKKYKCGLPGCPTILRTESELKNHRRLVHDNIEKQYPCPNCSYAAKTKTQLRR